MVCPCRDEENLSSRSNARPEHKLEPRLRHGPVMIAWYHALFPLWYVELLSFEPYSFAMLNCSLRFNPVAYIVAILCLQFNKLNWCTMEFLPFMLSMIKKRDRCKYQFDGPKCINFSGADYLSNNDEFAMFFLERLDTKG